MAGVQPCAVDRREAAPAVEHDPPVPGRSCSCLAMPTGYTPSPRLLGPRASLTRSSTEGSKAMLTQTPYPVPVNLAAVAAATAASAPSGWMSKKPRATSPASSIANYGRNLEPSLPLEVRERALRELARMLTRIDDRDVASTYEELKRHGITWKLVALISELQASVDNAPAVDSCPSPPSMNGTLLRWCLSCMANLTYFGGADLLKDSGVSGVLNILLFALYSSDPTIQSYAVVGLSNVSGDLQCAQFLDKCNAVPRLQQIASDELRPDVARRAKRVLHNMKLLQAQSSSEPVLCIRPPRSVRSMAVWCVLGTLLCALTLVYGWIWLGQRDGSQQLVGVAAAEIDQELTREITAHPHIVLHDAVEQSHVYS